MLVLCKHCLKSCKKFGKVDCDDYYKPTIDDIEKEYKKALQTDPEKAKEIKKNLDYFNWGIK